MSELMRSRKSSSVKVNTLPNAYSSAALMPGASWSAAVVALMSR